MKIHTLLLRYFLVGGMTETMTTREEKTTPTTPPPPAVTTAEQPTPEPTQPETPQPITEPAQPSTPAPPAVTTGVQPTKSLEPTTEQSQPEVTTSKSTIAPQGRQWYCHELGSPSQGLVTIPELLLGAAMLFYR